ncbi:pentapeptide repeat-containing protein [Thiotrichales bacterium 19S3-7]|nr:pentapeptide repeat-containing protein [Thiotrichales bacterium 19S3-7]MCF6802673.1 pentapeptide repeat-containing protein [Thiotrichales bacterium 19S3-11]
MTRHKRQIWTKEAEKMRLLLNSRIGRTELEKLINFAKGYKYDIKISLKYRCLSGLDLSGLDLSFFILENSNLMGTNLMGTNLTGTNLTGTNLRNADLRNATLRRAILDSTDLRDATLKGADLKEASLRRAILWRADLRDTDLTNCEGLVYYKQIKAAIFDGATIHSLDDTIQYYIVQSLNIQHKRIDIDTMNLLKATEEINTASQSQAITQIDSISNQITSFIAKDNKTAVKYKEQLKDLKSKLGELSLKKKHFFDKSKTLQEICYYASSHKNIYNFKTSTNSEKNIIDLLNNDQSFNLLKLHIIGIPNREVHKRDIKNYALYNEASDTDYRKMNRIFNGLNNQDKKNKKYFSNPMNIFQYESEKKKTEPPFIEQIR